MAPKKSPAKIAVSADLASAFKTVYGPFVELMRRQPWEIVHESVILGVQDPLTKEVYYAYFMGELAEVIGINLYDASQIAVWRDTLNGLDDDPESFSPGSLLDHSFLQLTIEVKDGLPKEEIALHTAAGIKLPKGSDEYLSALSFEAGYAPVTPDEAALSLAARLIPGFIFLVDAIENEEVADPEDQADEGLGLIASAGSEGEWKCGYHKLPDPSPTKLYDAQLPPLGFWKPLKDLPVKKDSYLLHAELLPLAFMDQDTNRASYSILVLCISEKEKTIPQFKQIHAHDWKKEAARLIFDMLEDLGEVPESFILTNDRLKALLDDCAATLPFAVIVDYEKGAEANSVFEFLTMQMSLQNMKNF